MRTIKFRGKTCGKDSRWIYGYLFHNGQFWYIQEGIISHGVEEESIGQFTGLLDREGKEIWEWDIVKHGNGTIQKVIWIKCETFSGIQILGHGASNLEVLGNVYEHPELLK